MTLRRLVCVRLLGLSVEFGGSTPRIGHGDGIVGNWRQQWIYARKGNLLGAVMMEVKRRSKWWVWRWLMMWREIWVLLPA